VLAALAVSAIVVAVSGVSPLFAFRTLFQGGFGRVSGLVATCIKATPLLLSALAIIVAFRANIWNLGGNGQMYMGAVLASVVGLYVSVPAVLHLPLALLAGFCGGLLWIGIPAILRAYFKVSEVIVTLMFNYIAIFLLSWLVVGPLTQVGGFMPQSPALARTSWLPRILPPTRIHAGILVALVVMAVVYIMLFRTSSGYALRAIGANPDGARYGGINVKRQVLRVMCLSGGLMGLAGANEVLGVHHRLMEGIAGNYGFIGMVVAFLGGLHPLGALVATFFFSGLNVGADAMQRMTGIPISVAHILQALVVLFVVGSDILTRYELRFLWKRLFPRRSERQVPVQDETRE